METKSTIHIKETKLHLKTDTYEGPFEVVLDLIEKKKLSINELSLATITEEYITHVRSKAQFPTEDAAEFISVAATLLVIKSKSLIPELELSEDEEFDVSEFEKRLREYERVRSITRDLSRLFGVSVLVSGADRPQEPLFSPSRDLTLTTLERIMGDLLLAPTVEPALPEARVRSTITLEEMMDRLLERVRRKLSMTFSDFSLDAKERVEVIVSFLALLELIKQGDVHADQHDTFSEITIKNTTTTTPNYA